MHITGFWDVTQCSLLNSSRFRETCCLHLQERQETDGTHVEKVTVYVVNLPSPALLMQSEPNISPSHSSLHKYSFKAELHKIPARVQCTVQCADWIDEPAPPTIP
jgi:hypothetical protein